MIIYKFTNNINGKIYIGQSIQQNPKARFYDHVAKSKNPKLPFHFAIKKHSIDQFTFEVIDSAPTLEELNKLEQFYIEKFNSIADGYNIRLGGENKLHSLSSIEKMRQAQKDAHARRKADGRDGGWKRVDGGPMKNKKRSEIHNQNYASNFLAKYGFTNPGYIPYLCEHCGKQGKGLAGYKRWHGDNCRRKDVK